jgi:bifunctional non-homologous end joining protein LigD
MGLQGVVSKRLAATYSSGRGDSWTKSKCRGGQEVVIGAWRGTPTKLRSLLVGTYRTGKLVYMGRLGTGYTATLADDLFEQLNPLRCNTSPFAEPLGGTDLNRVEPELVAEIEYENVTSDGLFRQAAFKGLRLDTPAISVVMEIPVEAANKERPLTRKTMKEPNHCVLGVAISHPDKELWPRSDAGPAVTKLALAQYVAAAAERMLPHIARRPLSIVRAPDGIAGPHFFQRHALKGTAAPVLAIKVEGEKEPYLGVGDAKGLVALAQQAVLELHPWGSKPGDPEIPERIIFDLDPAPDVPFPIVMQAAKGLRRRLGELGFTPFVKTTGGKRLHVVIVAKGTRELPLQWSEAKAFAKTVAMLAAADDPDRLTTTMAKAARSEKIFIDYLRNDRSSTAVAPWSPRAREGATISVPLEWKELNARLDPRKFTIHDARELLKKPDPWRDLASSAKALRPALRKLGG